MDDLLLSLLSDCTVKEGATEDEMGYIMARLPPETRGHKCIAACMGESIGLVRNSSPKCQFMDLYNLLFFHP